MKILVLGGGIDQSALIRKLQLVGHEVIFADYYEHPPAVDTGARHFKVSTLDEGAILGLARAERVEKIFTSGTDPALVTCAKVSDMLGLGFALSPALVGLVTNKGEMKRRLFELGIPTAQPIAWYFHESVKLPETTFPAVVKPVDCAGSLGVVRVDNAEELYKALECARQLSRSNTALVEAFTAGREISVDAFVDGGVAQVLMVTESEKRPNLRQFPILRSWYPAPSIDPLRDDISRIVQAIVTGFDIGSGPLLVQMIHSPTGLSVLEFGVRIGGGGKYALIEKVTGFDILQGYLDVSFGVWQGPVCISEGPSCAAMTYVYCERGRFLGLEGLELLQAEGVVDEVFLYKTYGATVEGQFASRDRPLSYISTAATTGELIQKLERAEREIRVLGDQGVDIRLRHAVMPPWE